MTGLAERDIEHLSDAERALCKALAAAIQHVQQPRLMGGRLPKYVSSAVLRWDRARIAKIVQQPMAIEAVVRLQSAKGLPKKLSSERVGKENEPTAFSETARILGIAETTVRNKRRGTNRR